MADKHKDGSVRLTLEFSPSAAASLEALKMKAGSPTETVLIREALRLYDYLLTHRDDGWQTHLVKDGKAKEILLTDDSSQVDDAASDVRSTVTGILERLKSAGGHVTVDLSLENHQRLEKIREETDLESLNDALEIVLDAFEDG